MPIAFSPQPAEIGHSQILQRFFLGPLCRDSSVREVGQLGLKNPGGWLTWHCCFFLYRSLFSARSAVKVRVEQNVAVFGLHVGPGCNISGAEGTFDGWGVLPRVIVTSKRRDVLAIIAFPYRNPFSIFERRAGACPPTVETLFTQFFTLFSFSYMWQAAFVLVSRETQRVDLSVLLGPSGKEHGGGGR